MSCFPQTPRGALVLEGSTKKQQRLSWASITYSKLAPSRLVPLKPSSMCTYHPPTEKNKPRAVSNSKQDPSSTQHSIRTAHAHRGALAPVFSIFSTLSIGCRTRAARLPSPFPPSHTQFPSSTPHMHMRMHRCPNRVSNPYPSPPSTTP